jgi:hypothetical protein
LWPAPTTRGTAFHASVGARVSCARVRVLANLDCEARWAGVTLPAAVRARLALYASLLAAFADADDTVEIWAPAAADPARLLAAHGWRPPVVRAGAIAAPDLAWAGADARDVNDRRFALALAQAHAAALPGARVLASVDELAAAAGPWIVKAAWTSAGRDRCRGDGAPTTEQRTRITRLLAAFGPLVCEPWMDRVLDVGACARVAPDGRVTAEPPHGLITDARGAFLGIDLAPPPLLATEHARLAEVVALAGAALHARGYAGPFSVDAFAYRAPDGARHFHPLCEINARYTFGWVAHALRRRLGTTRLGFSPAPAGATLLVAPGADGVTAWVA